MPNPTLAIGFSALWLASAPAGVRAEVLHDFSGQDGLSPNGALVRGAAGALYGSTTFGGSSPESYLGGVVFSLRPPPEGSQTWTEQVLHNFPATANDGYRPTGSLLAGPSGVLFGTTSSGQGNSFYGTIFQISPPATGIGPWTETILHQFGVTDGVPQGSLVTDAEGALYGVTSQRETGVSGTVFRLKPPIAGHTQWIFQTLHDFGSTNDGTDPVDKVVIDPAGNLYGATQTGGEDEAYGIVFRLSPPETGQVIWRETILYSFSGGNDGAYPLSGLSIDPHGALYGTTSSGGNTPACCGTVFKLSPPSDSGVAWTFDVIYSFHGPDGSLAWATPVLDSFGNLYGTTYYGGVVTPASTCRDGCGVVYKLVPPPFGAGPWTESTYSPGNNGKPNHPRAALLPGLEGFVYGTSTGGGMPPHDVGDGTIFRIRQ